MNRPVPPLILPDYFSKDLAPQGRKYATNDLQATKYSVGVNQPDKPDCDESKMSVRIYFADGSRQDGVGDVTEVEGIRTDRHRANPFCLFDHGKGNSQWATWPIAMSEDPDTKQYSVEIDPISKTAIGNAFFYQGNDNRRSKAFAEYCEQLYDLIVRRFIRGGSFSYQIIHSSPLQPDYARGVPGGSHLLATLLLEYGPVILPCNQDTVIKGLKNVDPVREILCMGKICGKALSPMLVKSLEPYQMPVKRMVSGPVGEKALNKVKCSRCGTQFIADTRGSGARGNCPKCSSSDYVKIGKYSNDRAYDDPVEDKKEKGSKKIPGDLNWLKEEGREAEHKAVAVPLNQDLTKTDIPPAKWKPGQGAMKQLRAKYGKKDDIKPNSSGGYDCPNCQKPYNTKPRAQSCCGKSPFVESMKPKPTTSTPPVNSNATNQKGISKKGLIQAFQPDNPYFDRIFYDEMKEQYYDKQTNKYFDSLREYGIESRYEESKKGLLSKQKGKLEDAYMEGAMAAENRQHQSKNPYPAGSSEERQWNAGFDETSEGGGFEGKKALSITCDYCGVPFGSMEPRMENSNGCYHPDCWIHRNEVNPVLNGVPSEKSLQQNGKAMIYDFVDKIKAALKQGGVEYNLLSESANTFYAEIIGDGNPNHAIEVIQDATGYEVKNRGGNKISVMYPSEKSLPRAGLTSNTKPKPVATTPKKPKLNLGGLSDPRAMKGLDILRKKYRSSKGLKRRLKKSIAGSTIMYVSGKDLAEAKESATKKGLKFVHLGNHKSGMEKVKLTGDDNAIDEMAKDYGRRIKRKALEEKQLKDFQTVVAKRATILNDINTKLAAIQKVIPV